MIKFCKSFLNSIATYTSITPIKNIVIDPSYTVCVSLDKTYIFVCIFFLKHHVLCQYSLMTDLTGVPHSNQENNSYFVIYELLSLRFNNRLRIKVEAINNYVFTVSNIYPPHVRYLFKK